MARAATRSSYRSWGSWGPPPCPSEQFTNALLIVYFGIHPAETAEILLRVKHVGPQEIVTNADLRLIGEAREAWFEAVGLTATITESRAADASPTRRSIPERVRNEVWRRDQGRCVDCGSRERLEFDHIIPVSKGGSNTARNIELRCEICNGRKAARI